MAVDDPEGLLARATAALPPEARVATHDDRVGAAIADARFILAANAYFLALVGEPGAPPALPLSWMRLTPPEHVAADAQAIAQARVTGVSAPYEKQYERPGGERARILLACGVVGAEPLPLFALVADATDPAACAAVRAWTDSPAADLRGRLPAGS